MQQPVSRNLVVMENCSSLSEAIEKAVAEDDCLGKTLTVIDTTADFNQNKWLGQELSHTLIYIDSKTRINGLLAVTGCVKGGSSLFFAFAKDDYGAFFQKYAIPTLKKIAHEAKVMKKSSQLSPSDKGGAGCVDNVNLEQLKALVDELVEHKVLHLIGERGTGKSSLLGRYIHGVCNDGSVCGHPHVVLVSPSRQSSVNTLKQLSNVSRETFVFLPPANVDNSALANATHVVVDEAASINRAVLNHIREQASGVLVFATTTDGYEGTGQSYRLSMMKDDDVLLRLDEPKRFCADDGLYQWGRQLCRPSLLLQTPVAADNQPTVCSIKQAYGNHWIIPAFALLQSAHYRTTPNDLANLYDNDGFLAVNVQSNKMIGAAHALPEAIEGLDDELITQIFYGRRRLKNAMTQQALIHAYGMREIADKKVLRISRIAVAEDNRQQGCGTSLVKALEDYAMAHQFDFLSTSFSCQADTLAFWLSQGFVPVRIGINKNKWHDSFSVLMLKPLHEESKSITPILQHKFAQHLFYYLPVYYENDGDSTVQLINAIPTLSQWLSKQNKEQYIVSDLRLFEHVCVPMVFLKEGCKQHSDAKLCEKLTEVDVKSVTAHHRDILWLLPSLYSLLQENTWLSAEYQSLLAPYFTRQLLDKKEKSNAKNALLFLKTRLNGSG